jgi:large subunit ribosomal protein L19
MSKVIENLERQQLRKGIPGFDAGDRVKVHFQVVEGNRRRTQVFEGTVIKRQGAGARETFTVRKQSFGVGVERTFPVHSPKIERIEVASRGDVRRAKLYYLRGRVGRRARVRERQYTGPEAALLADEPVMMDAEGTQDEAEPVDLGEQPDAGEGEEKAGEVGAEPREDAAAEGDEHADAGQAGAEPQAEGEGELASERSDQVADDAGAEGEPPESGQGSEGEES